VYHAAVVRRRFLSKARMALDHTDLLTAARHRQSARQPDHSPADDDNHAVIVPASSAAGQTGDIL